MGLAREFSALGLGELLVYDENVFDGASVWTAALGIGGLGREERSAGSLLAVQWLLGLCLLI